MLIKLGAGRGGPAGGDETLVEVLMACHARIRRFTALAITLAAPATASRPAAEIADGADAVRRYLAVALPLHIADEDASITPRLLAHDPALGPALDRMHAEHEAHAPLLTALRDTPSLEMSSARVIAAYNLAMTLRMSSKTVTY